MSVLLYVYISNSVAASCLKQERLSNRFTIQSCVKQVFRILTSGPRQVRFHGRNWRQFSTNKKPRVKHKKKNNKTTPFIATCKLLKAQKIPPAISQSNEGDFQRYAIGEPHCKPQQRKLIRFAETDFRFEKHRYFTCTFKLCK